MKPWTTSAVSFIGGVILAVFAIIGAVSAMTPDPNPAPGQLAQYDTK